MANKKRGKLNVKENEKEKETEKEKENGQKVRKN